uniref:C2H2-type domain-containing protein n=1 Tax=Lepeophtheirus salmonis TaxID=72036 RepID=A0A0K2TZ89_LEPSM
MNPNHPPYNSTNLNLLDNMLMAAGFQGTSGPEVPKPPGPMIPPGYGAYHNEMGLHHHAMNLATSQHVQGVESIPILVYQQQQQQQQQLQQQQLQQQAAAAAAVSSQHQQHQQHPISYKLPHHFEEMSHSTTTTSSTIAAAAAVAHHQHHHLNAKSSKKDIVAEALRSTEKIFEDKSSPHASTPAAAAPSLPPSLPSSLPSHTNLPPIRKEPSPSLTAIKSEPCHTPPLPKSPQDIKPVLQSPKPPSPAITSLTTPPTNSSTLVSKPVIPYSSSTSTTLSSSSITSISTPGRRVVTSSNLKTASISSSRSAASMTPRLSLLEEEDDGLTCRLCLQSFWYKSALIEHLKTIHSISDPVRYEREEREKKLKRIREEQQRIAMIRRQRELRGRGRGMIARGGSAGRGGARPGSIRLTSPGSKPAPAGPRPSFQYRDGAFICDLCKKSFSDGNDMVTHWKSHVKKSQLAASATSRGSIKFKASVRRTTQVSRRGAPTYKSSLSSERKAKPSGGKTGKRKDKGRPRWTSYLVWSTRRRKELISAHPGWSFAEVSRNISDQWKKVNTETKEKLQDEAEEMNATGVKKLPAEKPSSTDSDVTDTTEDSDFEESVSKKPIMLKIKREYGEAEAPRQRSGRQRKRPSFFQEFENEENNLDRILDDFELQQIQESCKPKEKKEKAPTRSPRQRRAKKREAILINEPEEPIELETSRSGRIRKKIKFFDKIPDFDDPGDLEEIDEDQDEFKPDYDEPEDHEDLIDEYSGSELNTRDESKSDSKNLPPKKRAWKKNKKNSSSASLFKRSNIMTDAEIEEATERARKAKPIILLDREDAKPLETDDSEIGRNSLRSSKSGVNEPTPSWIQDDEEIDHLSVKKEPNNETNVNAHVNNEIQSSQNDVTNPSDSDKEIHSNNDESRNLGCSENQESNNHQQSIENSDTIEGGGSGDGDGGDSDAASFPKLSSDDPSNNIDDVCLNTPMPCVPEEDDHQDPPSSILAPEEEEEKELIKPVGDNSLQRERGGGGVSVEDNSLRNVQEDLPKRSSPETIINSITEPQNASQEEILTPITTGGDPFGSMDTPSQNNEHSDNNNPLYNQHESTNGEEEGRKKSDDNKDDNEISQSEPPPPPVDSTSVDELLRPGEDEEKYKDLISQTQIENIDNIFN